MNYYDAAAYARLNAYKRYVLDRYMEYVFDRASGYTILQCEKDYIAFRAFATAYRYLDDFEDHLFITTVLDMTIDRVGADLMEIPRPYLGNSFKDAFDRPVGYLVLEYLFVTRNFIPHKRDWHLRFLCPN